MRKSGSGGIGKAIGEWDVEARGTEFEVHNPQTGDIGVEGDTGAPTNLLAELLHAHNRPVRMHGAMLLSFFGDPRAKDAILELREALREDEAPYLDRLLQAVNDVKACNLKVSEYGDSRSVSACVFNASKEPRKSLGLRVRGLDHRTDRARAREEDDAADREQDGEDEDRAAARGA